MTVSSQEKGTALEVRLAKLFADSGYTVSHNVLKEGRSGASHQIDVYAQYDAPLHSSRIVIEAKSYEGPVDKDRVMKLIQIVDDIGADKGILISTSSFTPSAIKTSHRHNIDLWDRDELAKRIGTLDISASENALPREAPLRLLTVSTKLSEEHLKALTVQAVDKRRKGGLFGVGSVEEKVADFTESHYPYYEISLECAFQEVESRGILKSERVEKLVPARISVDATTGEIVTVENGSITYRFGYLVGLSQDETSLLRRVAQSRFSKDTLLALGFTPGKAQRLLSTLTGKGLLQTEKGERGKLIYHSVITFPDPRSLRSIGASYQLTQLETPPNVAPLTNVDMGAVKRALEQLWPKTVIHSIETIYHPIRIAVLQRPDGARRIEVLDAVTGRVGDVWSRRIRP